MVMNGPNAHTCAMRFADQASLLRLCLSHDSISIAIWVVVKIMAHCNTAPNVWVPKKGTIILTTTHMNYQATSSSTTLYLFARDTYQMHKGSAPLHASLKYYLQRF